MDIEPGKDVYVTVHKTSIEVQHFHTFRTYYEQCNFMYGCCVLMCFSCSLWCVVEHSSAVTARCNITVIIEHCSSFHVRTRYRSRLENK